MKTRSCFLFLIALIGCSAEVNTPITTGTGTNNISIRAVNDTLAIGIIASYYNYNQNIDLSFSVDTAKLNMGVSYSGGTGLFRILRDTSVIFSHDMNSTFSISQQVFPGPPTKAVISLQNYTGTASILLTR